MRKRKLDVDEVENCVLFGFRLNWINANICIAGQEGLWLSRQRPLRLQIVNRHWTATD